MKQKKLHNLKSLTDYSPPMEDAPGATYVNVFPPPGLVAIVATPPPTDVTVIPSTESNLISGLILESYLFLYQLSFSQDSIQLYHFGKHFS
jgi:hypothetical protein